MVQNTVPANDCGKGRGVFPEPYRCGPVQARVACCELCTAERRLRIRSATSSIRSRKPNVAHSLTQPRSRQPCLLCQFLIPFNLFSFLLVSIVLLPANTVYRHTKSARPKGQLHAAWFNRSAFAPACNWMNTSLLKHPHQTNVSRLYAHLVQSSVRLNRCQF